MQLFIKLPLQANNYKSLFESGRLGDADTKDPKQLQGTAWFNTYLYDESSVVHFIIQPIVLCCQLFSII